MLYNQEIEDRISEIFDEASCDDDITPMLVKLYEETKYPGVLYWMAFNYEEGLYCEYDKDKAFDYYMRAAIEDYRGAMLWLTIYYMKSGSKELYCAHYWIEKAIEQVDSQYAQFLLSKVYLLIAIYEDGFGMYKKGIKIMEDLANDGYTLAQDFLESEEINEDNDLTDDIFELIDFEKELEEYFIEDILED